MKEKLGIMPRPTDQQPVVLQLERVNDIKDVQVQAAPTMASFSYAVARQAPDDTLLGEIKDMFLLALMWLGV
eukprot:7822866-Alexandrium_andersonii.AAC.1